MPFKHSLPIFIIMSLLFLGCKEEKKTEKPTLETAHAHKGPYEFLVGTWTNDGSKGIYRMLFDPLTATIENKGLMAEQNSPSYLYIGNDRQRVYSVNETEQGSISLYQWNGDRTHLVEQGQKPSRGMHPCYIDVDEKNKRLAAANYSSGDIVVYNLADDASLAGEPHYIKNEGSGPVKPNQEGPRAHCAKFSPDGKFLYVVDLGTDEVAAYPIDFHGNIDEKKIALAMDKGDGSRHLIFHPSKNMAFISSELSSTVTSARTNPETGLFEKIDRQSTLPRSFKEPNYVADLHISPDGKFLYVSNRGHNSIAIFAVGDKGKLNLLHTEPTQGNWPRNFQLTPDGNHLLVANQQSNDIAVFKVDKESGMLIFTGNKAEIQTPVFIGF